MITLLHFIPNLTDKSVIAVLKIIKELEKIVRNVDDEHDEHDDSTQPIGKMPTPRGKRKAMTRVVLPQDTAEHVPGKKPRLDGKQQQGRCVVCCAECINPREHTQCRGFRVDTGCWHCAVLVQKEIQSKRGNPRARIRPRDVVRSGNIINLCDVQRYKSHGDERTCFQIHHECNGNLPDYVGCQIVRAAASAASAESIDTP